MGAFFAPILSGTAATWAEANRVVAAAFLEPAAWQARLAAAPDYRTFERVYLLDWLGGMCARVGIPRPAEEWSLALAREAEAWITARVEAALPGAVDILRLLHGRGYTVHTASGESSVQLAGYLTHMGVREYVGRLYGPDLIDTLKAGPAYYERLLVDAAVAPADAVVVDDSPTALGWAAAAGARTVYVGLQKGDDATGAHHIPSVAALPDLLAQLESGCA